MIVHESAEKKNLESAGGDALLTKVGGANAGLPFFAFLDAKGALIVNSLRTVEGRPAGQNIGHPFQPQEIQWFMTMLKKAAPKISDTQARTIEDWLKNQKK